MTKVEDFLEELQSKYNKFLIDTGFTKEFMTHVKTGTAEIINKVFQLLLETGSSSGSTAKTYYNYNQFNPFYSDAYFRIRLENVNDLFAFFGFKSSFTDPTFNMTETHSGVMINNGKIYFSTGNEIGVTVGQQRTEISGIDMTKDFIFKIDYNKIFTMPLPQIIPYFDTFRIITPDRIWSLKATNSTYPPEDKLHYMVFFIKNNVNENKGLMLRHFMYLEEYAD